MQQILMEEIIGYLMQIKSKNGIAQSQNVYGLLFLSCIFLLELTTKQAW